MKIATQIYPLVIAGILLFPITNSCKKDETTSKKDPVISWSNPADIGYGTLLSPTQLNATADVPGIFVYTPAIWSKLNEGTNQELKVDFTPTDATNYNTAIKTVKINVLQSLIMVTDIDGNKYHTILIGTQTWMVENLKTTKYNDGTDIPNVTDSVTWSTLTTPAYCWYKNNATANKDTYGALYNWHAVNTGKLCPGGWHVPTDIEWTILANYLILNGYNFDGTTAINKYAKALASASGWNTSTVIGTIGNNDYPIKRNATGFSALPGGSRWNNGKFDFTGSAGNWWSSTEDDEFAWLRNMSYYGDDVLRAFNYKNSGFSVRCIKN